MLEDFRIDNNDATEKEEDEANNSVTSSISTEIEDSENTNELNNDNINEEPDKKSDKNWIIKLSSISDSSGMIEFGDEYIFKAVNNPDETKSDKFIVFCKPENSDRWECEAFLTKRYNIASIEKFIENLSLNLDDSKAEIKKIPYHISYSNFATEENLNLNLFDGEIGKLLFTILIGEDINNFEKIKSNLLINVINSYNGKKRLRIDYNLKSSYKINDKDVDFVDYFTLSKHSKSIVHKSGLFDLKEEIISIIPIIQTEIDIIKTYDNDLRKHIENIADCFIRDSKKLFYTYCGGLTGAYLTLFYVLIVASIVLSKDYNLMTHFKVKNVVDKIFKNIRY